MSLDAGISFGSGWALVLILVVVAVFAVPQWNENRKHYATLRYSGWPAMEAGRESRRLRMRQGLLLLRFIAIILLIIASARPQTGEATEILRGQGVDIVIALDISRSMSAQDFEPQNRLEAAKDVITEFIRERPYDRIGLVVFARDSFVQSPPTIDHKVLERQLRDVGLAGDLRIEDGTAIGLGLASAANMLKDSPAKSKVVTLLSDGANNTGEIDPQTAALAAQALGIKVYTIGMGDPAGGSLRTGPFRRPIPSDLDEATLIQIAETSGALYHNAKDTSALKRIYEEINDLEKSEIEVRRFTIYDDIGQWLILPALALLVLELFLRHTVFRKIP